MSRSLSVTEWYRMAMEGAAPPMRILLKGCSMEPLVRRNIDYVTIVPLEDNVSAGDIVLFSDKKTGRYIVHRVWKVEDREALTWGDNCQNPDGWFPIDVIWGKVVLIERGRRTIHPDSRKGLLWARFWHKIRPVYNFCWKTKAAIVSIIKKRKV